jgi:hypothetical protein
LRKARPGPVGPVAVLDEDAHDRIGDRCAILDPTEHAGLAREIAMAGDPADDDAEPQAGLDAMALADPHRLKADVIGLLERRDPTAAVEGDVELARQAVERTVVEDVIVPFPRERPGVAELLRIDSRGGRPGDVSDIVRTRSARTQANVLDGFDGVGGVRRHDFANLQIGPRRDMRVAAAEPGGDIGDARELPIGQDSIGNAQTQHVARLRRRDIEEAEIAPAEIVVGLGKRAGLRLRLEARVGVERMLAAFPFFLIGKLNARRDGRVLRGDMSGVRPCRRCRRDNRRV